MSFNFGKELSKVASKVNSESRERDKDRKNRLQALEASWKGGIRALEPFIDALKDE